MKNERAATIKTMIEGGLTATQIAKEVRCSLTVVYRVSKLLGLKFVGAHRTDAERLKVAEYYKTHSLMETAQHFGISCPTVCADAKLLRIKKQRGPAPRPGNPGSGSTSSDILTKVGLQLTETRDLRTKENTHPRKHFWLHRYTTSLKEAEQSGERLELNYPTEVMDLRRDPMTWLKSNAARLNETFGGKKCQD